MLERPLRSLWLCMTLSGCATLVNGQFQEVKLVSSPSGATVWIDGYNRGIAPTAVLLSRDSDHVVTYRLDGHDIEQVKLERSFDFAPTILGNLITLDPLGIIGDMIIGGAYKFEVPANEAYLSKLPASPAPDGDDAIATPDQGRKASCDASGKCSIH